MLKDEIIEADKDSNDVSGAEHGNDEDEGQINVVALEVWSGLVEVEISECLKGRNGGKGCRGQRGSK